MENYIPLLWLGAIILFCVAEALTFQFVSIWFAGGALVSLIASMFKVPFWVQIVIFFVVSGVLLALTRPIVKKLQNGKMHATNADLVIGKIGVVQENIDNLHGCGRVFVDGLSWSARSEDNSPISTDQRVEVIRIEGAKIFVKPVE